MATDLEFNPLFKGIEKEYLEFLYPLFVRVICTKGTVVIKQGEAADFLYLVEKGKVEISYKPYDGEAITITHVGRDGLFGWSALLGSSKYTSSGIAIEDVEALRIRGTELRELCVENPEAGKKFLDRLASAVSARWKDAHKQVRSILEIGVTG
ncbi:MAG TPA: cyclic nucleotide-binding domain-containing protein [Anaerolineales bacterium]|nr:cyclic nucleotide-binding domain-containing protein [Anaerolineales bacterium]